MVGLIGFVPFTTNDAGLYPLVDLEWCQLPNLRDLRKNHVEAKMAKVLLNKKIVPVRTYPHR
jgi:hypothetical protein